MAKMPGMKMPTMKMVGSYHPPKAKGSYGMMNMPKRGRVGKNMPSIKQFTPLKGPNRRG